MAKVNSIDSAPSVGEMIRHRLQDLGWSLSELALRTGGHLQTLSAIVNGKRECPISLSVSIDEALGFDPGTIAGAQTRRKVAEEMRKRKSNPANTRIDGILKKIKANGGFWSYDGIPENLDDDSVIEAALVHLDLEDLPQLLDIWSQSHIKRVWKERLASQGKRMDVLNYILAVKFFRIRNPDNYLLRYAKSQARPRVGKRKNPLGMKATNLSGKLKELHGCRSCACTRMVPSLIRFVKTVGTGRAYCKGI